MIPKKSEAYPCPTCKVRFTYLQAMRQEVMTQGRLLRIVQCPACGRNAKFNGSEWVSGIDVSEIKPISVTDQTPEPAKKSEESKPKQELLGETIRDRIKEVIAKKNRGKPHK